MFQPGKCEVYPRIRSIPQLRWDCLTYPHCYLVQSQNVRMCVCKSTKHNKDNHKSDVHVHMYDSTIWIAVLQWSDSRLTYQKTMKKKLFSQLCNNLALSSFVAVFLLMALSAWRKESGFSCSPHFSRNLLHFFHR